jgi:hypothetical protein
MTFPEGDERTAWLGPRGVGRAPHVSAGARGRQVVGCWRDDVQGPRARAGAQKGLSATRGAHPPWSGATRLRRQARRQVDFPPGLSSTMTPAAARRSRMRSDSAKSLALRAAMRASTRRSTSASASDPATA